MGMLAGKWDELYGVKYYILEFKIINIIPYKTITQYNLILIVYTYFYYF